MNFSALDKAPSKQQISAYMALHPEQKQFMHFEGEYAHTNKIKANATFKFSLWITIIASITILSAYFGKDTNTTIGGIPNYILIIMVVIPIALMIIVAMVLLTKFMKHNIWKVATQLDTFARDNGLRHIRDQIVQPQGLLNFDDPHYSYLKTNALASEDYEVGSIYAYNTKDNRYSSIRGYISIPLRASLPNMVLATKSRSNLLNLIDDTSSMLRNNDKVELEGDFNNYFTLIVPKGYQVLARYFFTPDVMALFIDNNQGHDVEIIDDTLYVYVDVDWFNHLFWIKMQRIYDTIGAKMVRESEQYKETNITAVVDMQNQTPAQNPGKRLVRNRPLIAVGFTLFIVLSTGYRFYTDISHTSPTTSSTTNAPSTTDDSDIFSPAQIEQAASVSKNWLTRMQHGDYPNAYAMEDQGLLEHFIPQKQEQTFSEILPVGTTFDETDRTYGRRTADNMAVVSIVYKTANALYIRINMQHNGGPWKVWSEANSSAELSGNINANP